MYGFVVTTAGQGMLTRAAAGEALTLTGVQVGKGVAASREAALALTALIDPVANGTSTEPAVSGNQLSMIVEYRNDMNGGLEEGFNLSEFGVLARVGDDAPALLYYASLGDSPQPVQPESAGLDVHRFPVAVAVTDEVTVTLGYPAGAFVTADALEGYVPLGEDGKVPGEYLPEMDYIPTSQKGAAGGVASLGADGKVPTGQLPVGTPNGVAGLDGTGKVPTGQLPAMNYLPTAGGTMSGAINMNGQRITNLPEPQADAEPLRKGDTYSKAQQLADETKTLYGLGTDAVPDDVFTFLGKYNQYWWKRRRVTPIENRTKVDFIFDGNSSASYYPVEYSSDVSGDILSGLVALKEPVQTLSLSYEDYTDVTRLRNKYFHPYFDKKTEKIYYCDSNAQFSQGSSFKIEATNAYEITYSFDTEAWEYLWSTDREAYPDRGASGGYEYQFLGIPFDNAVEVPKIATGRYVGTGTYGASNPNMLTFEFEPKLVLICDRLYSVLIGTSYTDNPVFGVIWGQLEESYTAITAARYSTKHVKKTGTTMYWYDNDGSDLQLNGSGSTYIYIALG